jgi:hypothetical protein
VGNERRRIVVVREGDTSDPTFAYITIQAKDLRPCILRRWSGTGISNVWSLEDRSFGAHYWRARSEEKLVAKATKKLRRNALRLGIENPVIQVIGPDALSSAEMLEVAGHRNADFRFGEAAPVEVNYEVEVVSSGARSGG